MYKNILIITFSIFVIANFSYLAGCDLSTDIVKKINSIQAPATEKSKMPLQYSTEKRTPIIRSSGQITLKSTTPNMDNKNDYFDLDNSSDKEGSGDIVFTCSYSKWIICTIRPVNGAMMFFTGLENIDNYYCLENIDRFTSGSIPEIVKGMQICVQTNDCRIGTIEFIGDQLNNLNINEYSIDIEYVVWEDIFPCNN